MFDRDFTRPDLVLAPSDTTRRLQPPDRALSRPPRMVHSDGSEREIQCPRQESNLRLRLRRATLYPLSYEGGTSPKLTGDTR
jgi:hypothetical protein